MGRLRESDRRTLIDGVAGMCVAEPVRREDIAAERASQSISMMIETLFDLLSTSNFTVSVYGHR